MSAILIDDDITVEVRRDINGSIVSGFRLGDSTDQEVYNLLQMNKGEIKSDPLLGINLTTKIRSVYDRSSLERTLRIQFARDNKDFNQILKSMSIDVK